MKLRHWIAVVAISTACVVSLAALQAPSAELVSPTDPGVLIRGANGQGKGKGPKCKNDVFCNPLQCEQYDCGHTANSCCVCVPIPDCVPAP